MAGAVPEGSPLTAAEFRNIGELMHRRFGIDLRHGKEGLVAARLGRKLRAGGFSSFGAYFAHALADATGEALIDMVDALTTNHTSFMRERAHFDFLTETVLAEAPAPMHVHIWSAACSTGEEPYSIACTLLNAMKGGVPRFHVLATDLSTRVLKTAREGVYPASRFEEFPEDWKRAFLLKGSGEKEGWFRIKPEVAKTIDFGRVNLMEPFSHGRRFHVVFCRNVMMYFDRATQENLVNRLSACLEPGGYLLVGHSETLTSIEHDLRYVRPSVYRRERGRIRA